MKMIQNEDDILLDDLEGSDPENTFVKKRKSIFSGDSRKTPVLGGAQY